MRPWQVELEAASNRIVGHSRVYLQQSECSKGNATLAIFTQTPCCMQDAKTSVSNWSNVTIALTTQGNFRVPIPAGNITYKQLVAMCPWENRLVSLTLRGQHIWDLLEDSVVPMNSSSLTPRSSRFLQVSGFRINYNLAAASGQRVVSVRVRCSNCEVPVYRPLKLDKTYRLVVMEYLANGKNGFNLISDNAGHLEMGPFDLDSLMNYMRAVGPIITGIEHRINFLNTQNCTGLKIN